LFTLKGFFRVLEVEEFVCTCRYGAFEGLAGVPAVFAQVVKRPALNDQH
jgi:hypothetical protein